MSTIQQLKNFIRHGKQARGIDDQPAAKNEHDSHPAPQLPMAPAVSEPILGAAQPAAATKAVPDNFSHAPGDDQHNRVAQAGHAAAHHAEAGQNIAAAAKGTATATSSSKKKQIDNSDLAKLVAEENASRSKFPRYPGLERFELLEKMGDGAFSHVYRARDLEGGAGEVAIKVVRKFEMNNMQRANILKEVQIVRGLDHPNIIKLVDFSESRQYYYIILELAPGGELFHQIVRLTYFSEELSRHVITQVAVALEYLHEEKGVVHRDIKPENILYEPIPFIPSKTPKPKQPGDEDKAHEGEFIQGVGAGGIGRIKIADFGLSKIVWDTQTMTPCGTVGYTAPEIVKDERYSKSVDMWALGCVLYTLLCGFPPFYDESIEVLTEKVAKGQYTFLSPWWDDISKQAQDLISHLLDVDPEKRYTIRQFLDHPWIRATGPTPREEKRNNIGSDGLLRAFDPAKMEGRYDFRSPGAVNLREVFDVSYAVHRQEEEGRRRKEVGSKAAGTTGAAAGPGGSRLVEVSEESDEEMADGDNAGGNEYVHKASGAQHATQQLEQSMRKANIRDGDQEGARGRERERHHQPAHKQPPPEQKGYGQHSAAITAAARQQVRDRNRARGPFELSLDGASILGRRAARA